MTKKSDKPPLQTKSASADPRVATSDQTAAHLGMSIAPPVTVENDWEEVTLPFHIGSGRSIYSGLEGGERLRLRIFKKTNDGSLVGRAWFGHGADGPPLRVHGGATAYVLDEAMGSVAWMNNLPVVAAKLEFQYTAMAPLLVDLHLSAHIISQTARRVRVEAELTLPTGEVCVSGRGEFAVLTRAKIAQLGAENHDPQRLLQNPKLKWAPDYGADS